MNLAISFSMAPISPNSAAVCATNQLNPAIRECLQHSASVSSGGVVHAERPLNNLYSDRKSAGNHYKDSINLIHYPFFFSRW